MAKGKTNVGASLAQKALRVFNDESLHRAVSGEVQPETEEISGILEQILMIANSINEKVDNLRKTDEGDMPGIEALKKANEIGEIGEWKSYLERLFLKMAFTVKACATTSAKELMNIQGADFDKSNNSLHRMCVEILELFAQSKTQYEIWQMHIEKFGERFQEMEERAKELSEQEMIGKVLMLNEAWENLMTMLAGESDQEKINIEVGAFYMQVMTLLFKNTANQSRLMVLDLSWYNPNLLGENYAERLLSILSYFRIILTASNVALRALRLVETK